MRPSTTCILSVPLLISGSIDLPECVRGAAHSTAISYHQFGICKGYDTAAGPVTTRSDEAFAIFKIEAVDNTKPSGSFDFDPTHLYVDQSTLTKGQEGCVGQESSLCVFGPEIRAEHGRFECCGNHYPG